MHIICTYIPMRADKSGSDLYMLIIYVVNYKRSISYLLYLVR